MNAQLDALLDRRAIEDQILRVGAMLDDNAFDSAQTIFAPEVEIDTPHAKAVGIDAAVAQAKVNHEHATTQHLITNILVTIKGDNATARADVLATTISLDAADASRRTVAGRYEYAFARFDAGWLVTQLTMKPRWHEFAAA